ncbi:MAG: replicative DNA helicase [Bacteroidetes bacterium]|nr:MAG: replicative DNA helicase [Bacteroidota bacterium]
MSKTEEKRNTGTKRSTALSAISQQLFEIGKLPPQATDLEEAVLGALMLEKDALTTVIDILQPRSFYKESHGRIFSAIQNLFQRSEPIDILTVTNELKRTGELEIVGGAYFISQLTNRVASAANVEFHARIISQKYIQRELIRISTDTIKDAYEDTADVFDLLDSAERNLFSVVEGNIRKNYDKMSTLIGQAIKQIELAKNQKSGVSGVPSGFTALDRVTSGWQNSDLVILAARPAMGKTAFALTLARNAAVEFTKPIAVFSLEMSSLQLVQRLIASESELSSEKLRKGALEEHEFQQLHAKIGRLTEAPIFIDDTPALSVFELRAKARRLKAQHDISMIVIDYLQLMTVGGDSRSSGNREQEISTISRSLKSIAKELNIPVIALSQLSRAVESRGGDKRPQLSDLRESGAIEQDADMVLFIHRPEYYGFTVDAENNSTQGMAEIIIAKHRNGPVGSVNLRFVDRLAKFMDLDLPTIDGGSGMGGYDPQAGINPNDSFSSDNPNNTIIRGSKLNDIEEEPF